MQRAGDDDEQFASFMSAGAPRLYRVAYLLAGNPAHAEELTQQAHVRSEAKNSAVRASDHRFQGADALDKRDFFSQIVPREIRKIITSDGLPSDVRVAAGPVDLERSVDLSPRRQFNTGLVPVQLTGCPLAHRG